MIKYTFRAEHAAEIEPARRGNKDKKIEARLKVLALRADGKSLSEISEITGYHRSHVSGLIRQYFEEGITSITQKHYSFRNEIFSTLEKVVDRLCDTICFLTKTDVTSITGREWILSCF